MNHAIAGRATAVASAPFITAAFLGAALIFLVQPMFARMATPLLGGAPAVWNVSLVCFQAALLAGYAYAHLLAGLKSVRFQVIIHAVVLGAGLLCLPLHISGLFGEPDAAHPTLWLIGTFAVSIAPPFAALAATAPLVQHWYARTGLPDAADPYHLYAASNIGSLVGLAAYPLLIEPVFALSGQAGGWMFGYIALGGTLLLAGWSLQGRAEDAVRHASSKILSKAPSFRQMLVWLAFALAPSSLLVGVTTHITTDVAAAPFLWAPPLILYLLTFVMAFSRKPVIPRGLAARLAPVVIVMAALAMIQRSPLHISMAVDLLALFVVSLACHEALGARRPEAAHLTRYYLIMSLGGVLGGAFNALLAPVLFETVIEYPLMLVAALALLALDAPRLARNARILLVGAALSLAAALAMRAFDIEATRELMLALFAPAMLGVIFARRSPLTVALLLAMVLPAAWIAAPLRATWIDRSFFGVLKVMDDSGNNTRVLLHGTTMHGSQGNLGKDFTPLTYYANETPIGQSFLAFPDAHSIGVIGLGAGATACYARAGQDWTFYEIDPLVVKVATDPRHFTFMDKCQPGARIIVGDARINLATPPQAPFDLLLLDAFTSDSVPTHLLTVEAMRLYLDRMADDGLLVVHVSNRHMDLAPVVARLAAAVGADAIVQNYRPAEGVEETRIAPTLVVAVSRSPATLDRLRISGLWTPAVDDGRRPWTDDYSNTLGAIVSRINQD